EGGGRKEGGQGGRGGGGGLGGRGRRRDDGIVSSRQRVDERRHRLGQHVLVAGAVGEQNLSHAVELGGGFGHRPAVLAGDQHMHGLPKRLGGGQRLGGRILERLVGVPRGGGRGPFEGATRRAVV